MLSVSASARRTLLAQRLTARLHRHASCSNSRVSLVLSSAARQQDLAKITIYRHQHYGIRSLSAASAAAAPRQREDMLVEPAVEEASPDLVRSAIQKILDEAHGSSSSLSDSDGGSEKTSAPTSHPSASLPDLQRSLENVQHQLEETSRCIGDCRETTDTASFDEEVAGAEMALDKAVLALTDWMDNVRQASSSSSTTSASDETTSMAASSQQEPTSAAAAAWTNQAFRDSLAHRIKELRQELCDLKKSQRPAAATADTTP